MARTEAERNAALDKIIDRMEIQDLALRYCRAVDRREWDILPTLYHADSHNIYGSGFEGGPKDFVAWLSRQVLGLENTAHYILNKSYRLDGDYAEGEIYFIAYHRTKGDPMHELFVSGRYLDRYERRRGGPWKIAKRTIVWDWTNDAALTPESLKMLHSGAELAAHEDDLSYRMLKLFKRNL
jgi:hypothetical protein